MKSLFILFLSFLLCNTLIKAQDLKDSKMSKLNLYLEVGTNVLVSSTSVNLEALLANSRSGKANLYGRVGFGGAGIFWGPVGFGGLGALTILTGKGKHHFEASGGVFLGTDNGSPTDALFVIPLVDLGYRFQKPKGGFVFRGKVGVLGVGLGLGYAF